MNRQYTRRDNTQMTDTLSLRERMGKAQVRGKETHKCHPEFISGSTPFVTIPNKEEMLKQVQHDNRRGFTLIELLVVVLIIGILAAVAMPQYQKAVAKSRFTEAMSNLKAISQADAACRLAKGEGDAACEIGELDIQVGESEGLGESSKTENFRFMASHSPAGFGGAVAAQYLKEDVCLCLYPSGKFVVRQWRDSPDCVSKAASMDYAKLLNVPDADELDEDEEGYFCGCC